MDKVRTKVFDQFGADDRAGGRRSNTIKRRQRRQKGDNSDDGPIGIDW